MATHSQQRQKILEILQENFLILPLCGSCNESCLDGSGPFNFSSVSLIMHVSNTLSSSDFVKINCILNKGVNSIRYWSEMKKVYEIFVETNIMNWAFDKVCW